MISEMKVLGAYGLELYHLRYRLRKPGINVARLPKSIFYTFSQRLGYFLLISLDLGCIITVSAEIFCDGRVFEYKDPVNSPV